MINEEHCRLCGEVVDDSGGDGLCEACYFAHADPGGFASTIPGAKTNRTIATCWTIERKKKTGGVRVSATGKADNEP